MGGKGRDRTVYKSPQGWAEKRNDGDREVSYHKTQAGAVKQANKTLQNQSGGELIITGEDGKIRSKDTIPPGNKSPKRDKEH